MGMSKIGQAPLHMENSPSQWIAGGLLDAEYKEYLLLAWLQKLKAEFKATRLYPALADIIRNHKALVQLEEELKAGKERGDTVGFDLKRLRVIREATSDHQGLEKYLDDLIQRALPHLTSAIAEGKALYDLIESQLDFVPVGIQPLHLSEGYLLVTMGDDDRKSLEVYRYQQSRILRGGEAFHELNLRAVESRDMAPFEQPDEVKWSLIGRFRDLPQPATFHAHVEWTVPVRQTLLPIAKRKLLREIAQC